jgi:hypothetical protein
MLNIEFSATQYRFNHGKNPSGYGLWAFAEQGGPEIFAPYSMTLTEAKKWFKQHLKSMSVEGSFLITVCP